MSTTEDTALWPHAQALREIRGQLSVEKAARRVDVDRQTWTAWEKGTQVPRYERLKAIVEEFECPPDAIGYEAPVGWELVPAEWVRQAIDEIEERAARRHAETLQAIDGLMVTIRAGRSR